MSEILHVLKQYKVSFLYVDIFNKKVLFLF